jgi:hypothetical protein
VSLPRSVFGIDSRCVQPLCVALVSVWEAHQGAWSLPKAVILHAETSIPRHKLRSRDPF